MKSEAETLWRRVRFDRQAGADFAKAAVNMERSELPWPPVCDIIDAVIVGFTPRAACGVQCEEAYRR